MKNITKVLIVTVVVIGMIITIFAILNSQKGSLRIVTDYPDAQYKINNRVIDTEFELKNNQYEYIMTVKGGDVNISMIGPTNTILFEKTTTIKTNETTTINIDVEIGDRNTENYLLEGE